MGYSDARGVEQIRQLFDLVRYKIEHRGRFADIKYRSFCRIREVLERELGGLAGKRLVEVGCGQWQTNVLLFSALGAEVIGIDPELPPDGPLGYLGFAREAGLQRAFKTAANEVLLRPSFNRRLEELSGLSLRGRRPRLFRRGGEALPAEEGSVDAAFSDDVFEHLPDVAAVTREMARVLRPGAPALVIIHPFTAYSGGHHPATMYHGGERKTSPVPPWDHLRDRRFPSGVYLNGVREAEYRSILGEHLSIASWERLGPEGEEHLTEEVLASLPGYARDELLVGKIVCLAHKR
ncbi:MAG: methyltransferase domain-containing protein [Byssovorax sp.]